VKVAQLNKGISFNPFVPQLKSGKGKILKSTNLTQSAVAGMDCVIIGTEHSAYDFAQISRRAKQLFDTRGVTTGLKGKNITRLGE